MGGGEFGRLADRRAAVWRPVLAHRPARWAQAQSGPELRLAWTPEFRAVFVVVVFVASLKPPVLCCVCEFGARRPAVSRARRRARTLVAAVEPVVVVA